MEPMAGRRRSSRGAHPTPAPSTDEPALQDPADLRELEAAKRPSKKPCHATVSTCTSSVASSRNVWADLLECLLHQIMALLSSYSDILAFAATCHSWRAAFVSFPSTLSFNVPPLCLQPHIRYPETRVLPIREKRNIHYSHRRQIHINHSLVHNCEWQLTDPINGSTSKRCSPPLNLPNRMQYLGCSYGNIIISDSHQCLLVDVIGFTTVRPPKLKSTGKHDINYGILDGPLKSPNSHLFLCSRSSIFQWQVGSDAWLEHPLDIPGIFQIVFFEGEMFARDHFDGLHTICLAPELSIDEVEIDWPEREDSVVGCHVMYWLVVCDDMFLMVDLSMSVDRGATVFFSVFRLDFSIDEPRWVKVENLGNHSIFVSFDQRNPAFCCTCPERWGGKSNCIYVAAPQSKKNDKPWTMVELGQAVSRNWRPVVYRDAYPYGISGQPDNLWVFPSFVDNVGL